MIFDSVVIDIYSEEDSWPKEGDPADWIHDKKVGYVKGETEEFVVSVPLLKILRWKIADFYHTHLENLRVWWWARGRDIDKEWEDIMRDSTALTKEEEEEYERSYRNTLHMDDRKAK